jgi:lysophospholipid acyltransferase (LPLAT)-like uncharacterized protein
MSRRKKRFVWLRNLGKRLAVWFVPPLYNYYMWLIYNTSREAYSDLSIIWNALERGENVLGAVWHQDAILGPFIGRGRDVITMVSFSSLGNVLTEIMRKCHFIPIRGGSSRGGKEALSEIIEYINARSGVVCGIAVDGSRGPARKAQIGMVLIAQATGAPIYPIRLWAKRKLFAPTWDRTCIPFPFNELVYMVGQPLHIPHDADRNSLEGYRADLEFRLNELAERAERFFEKKT